MAKAKEVKPKKRKFRLELNEREAQLLLALTGKTAAFNSSGREGNNIYAALSALGLDEHDVTLNYKANSVITFAFLEDD